jgi:regulator of protease activity HflC (stomatin/prohibitin superfamily)
MRFGELNQGRVILWLASAAAIFVFIFGLWFWFGWRVEPGPSEYYVLIALTGDDLPEGKILAKEGQKGIQRHLIEAGRHFYNPISWNWERHDLKTINAGEVGVLVAKDGDPLPQGQVLADEGQKGIQRRVLTPGSYRIHPYLYELKVEKAVNVPAGSIGVVTALIGRKPVEGQILAKKGEQGIQEEILPPGTYYLNPFEVKVEVVKATVIEAGSVGVVTALTGKPLPEHQLLAREGERGVQSKVLEPGTYFMNPYAQKSNPISLRSHQLELTKEKGEEIEFPSSDGFPIEIDAAIEWRVKAEKVAEVFVRLGDEKDILDKVIRPNTRSISRIEGSKYAAKDFISGAGREKFEESFHKQLSQVCEAKGIEILRSLVRKIIVPEQIAKPIREAEVARQEKLRNEEQIRTQESAAQLAEKQALVEQRKRQVEAETKKIEAKTEAEKEKEVAEIAVMTAKQKAEAVKISAEAEAEATRKRLSAEADGMKMKVQAFGSGEAYAMFNFTQMVSKHTSFVFAPVGQGTFWTDPQAFMKMATQKLAAEQQQEKK